MNAKKKLIGLMAVSILAGGAVAQTTQFETVYNTDPLNVHRVNDLYGIANSHRVILTDHNEDWEDPSSNIHTIVMETDADGDIVNDRKLKNYKGEQIVQGLNHFALLSESSAKMVGFNFMGFNTWAKKYKFDSSPIAFRKMATLSGTFTGSQILAAGTTNNRLHLGILDIIDGAVASEKSHKIDSEGIELKVNAVYCGVEGGYIIALKNQFTRAYLVKVNYNLDVMWVKKIIISNHNADLTIHEIRSLGDNIVCSGTALGIASTLRKPIVLNVRTDGSQVNYAKVYSTNNLHQDCHSAEMSGGQMHLAIRTDDPNFLNAHTFEYIQVQGYDGVPTAGRRYSVSANPQNHIIQVQPTHIISNQGIHMAGAVIHNIHSVQTNSFGNSCDSDELPVLGLEFEIELQDVSKENLEGSISADNDEIEIVEVEMRKTEKCSQELRSSKADMNESMTDHAGLSAKIFPNPSSGQFNIQLEGATPAQIVITDLTGKTLQKIAYSGSDVQVSNLSSGIYLIKIQSEDLQVTERLIIQ